MEATGPFGTPMEGPSSRVEADRLAVNKEETVGNFEVDVVAVEVTLRGRFLVDADRNVAPVDCDENSVGDGDRRREIRFSVLSSQTDCELYSLRDRLTVYQLEGEVAVVGDRRFELPSLFAGRRRPIGLSDRRRTDVGVGDPGRLLSLYAFAVKAI